MTSRRGLQTACTAVVIALFAAICASSAGPVRQIAGLSLLCVFASACALLLMSRRRFDAIVPAIGLTLAFLILAGLALAAVHILSTVPVALVLAITSLAAIWAGAPQPALTLAERRARSTSTYLLAVVSVLIFAVATVLAIRYSADGATADSEGASSIAIWAYPSSGELHIGAEQPAGHGATSLRIVVTQAGATVATWNDIRLAPGQSWQAPVLDVTGKGPVRVVALHGGTVVASLSSR